MADSDDSVEPAKTDDVTLLNIDDQAKKIVQNAQRSVVGAVRASNGLPRSGGPFELYGSYPEFIQFMEEQENRILTLLSRTLKAAGCIVRVPKQVNDVEEFLDTLIEANDRIFEKTGILLDTFTNKNKEEANIVPRLEHGAESTFVRTPSRYSSLVARTNGLSDTSLSSPVLIEKPQIVYSIPVDNSHSKFVPKLKVKPHALKKAKSNLLVIDEQEPSAVQWAADDQGENPHPYDSELNCFKVPESQLKLPDEVKLKAVEDTELIMVDTVEKLKELRDVLNGVSEFAVDLEHHDYRSFLGMVCLMQISTRTTDYIIDPFPIWKEMGILNEPFTDPKILKVFHGADRDILWLQQDFGIYVVNMFDTYFASDILNFDRHNLGYIVNVFCGVTLDKSLQKSDWRLRPLSEAHINYARRDSHYLLHCYDKLRQRLIESGNETKNLLHYVFEKSRLLCLKVYEKPVFDSEGYETLVKKRINSQQRYALKNLYKWRDDRARAEDESIRYVLPDHMLLKIAEVLPREMQGILACCYPVPPFVKRELNVLHHIIHEARDQPLVENSLTAPHVVRLTFDSVIAQLSKMTKSKALLKCHLDFSSTKFDESIRTFGTEVDEGADEVADNRRRDFEYLDSVAKNNDFDIYPQQKYEIGKLVVDDAVDKGGRKLEKILQYLDEWATPYECYKIALEQGMREQERLENEQNAAVSKEGEGEKKAWTHHDPAREENESSKQSEAAELASKGSDEDYGLEAPPTSLVIFPEMTMTKKALKRKRKAETKCIEIPLSGSQNQQRASDLKKLRQENWTSAADTAENVVDYDSYDTRTFYGKPKGGNAYDPFGSARKGGRGGKYKTKHPPKSRSKVKGSSSLNSGFKRF